MLQMNTGKILSGSPCIGSWVNYGLGTVNQNLPGFVRHARSDRRPHLRREKLDQRLHARLVSRHHLPLAPAQPILDLQRPARRHRADATPHARYARTTSTTSTKPRAPTTATCRPASPVYELAFACRSHAAEAVDLDQETEETKRLYGLDNPQTQDFGPQVHAGPAAGRTRRPLHPDLLRRQPQRRQLGRPRRPGLQPQRHAGRTDKPIAGLIKDLKQRGLLDETLIVWGGEFGRQPTAEYAVGTGRDHNAYGFTMWMAGGGIKGGISVGDHRRTRRAAVEQTASTSRTCTPRSCR